MPLILGAQSAVATGFNVDNSCRFDDGSSAYLSSDFAGTGSSSAAIATYSVWIKTSTVQTAKATIVSNKDDGSNYLSVKIEGDDFRIQGISPICDLITDKKFRDPGAWYHIVMAFDTAQAVDTNRIKLWVNNERITDFSTATYLAQNDELFLTKSDDLEIGQFSDDGSQYYDGYMAEFVCIDGTAYTPSDFGEYDSDSPTIWKPKDVSGLTFGSKGYYLDFKDSAALGDDVSGNNNDFTENNIAAVDQCVDSPTNNFATFNPLDNYYQAITYSNGNMTMTTTGNISPGLSTIGLTAGKWYFEVKATDIHNIIGIQGTQITASTQYLGENANDWGYYGSNGNQYNNGSSTSYGDTYSTGDIIGVAVDLENNKLYFSKTNVWQNSGVPTSGATGTGAMSIGAASSTGPGYYLPGITSNTGSASANNGNFGNPPYANSSDAADENGYGKFEYAPPSGYLAICTKNLGSDGS